MPENVEKYMDKAVVFLRDRVGIRTMEFVAVMSLIFVVSVSVLVKVGSDFLESISVFASMLP